MTIHAAQLDLEQFGRDKEGEKLLELDVWSYWYNNGFPVEEILEAYSVVHEKPHDEDTAHIVVKVETLSRPIDEADIVADSTTVWACDCGRFAYHENVDLEDTSVTEWGHCHHIESCEKSIKAQNDENQRRLDE